MRSMQNNIRLKIDRSENTCTDLKIWRYTEELISEKNILKLQRI